MARALGKVVVNDIHGPFKPGIAADLIDPATGVRILDTVFADATSATTLSLPLTTDQTGRAVFWLASGKIVIGRTTINGVTYDDYIIVDDPTTTGGGVGGAVPPHIHVESDVTTLPTDLSARALVGHIHAETDVAGLNADLSTKAAAVHSHVETDVAGLGTDLAATEKTVNKGVANGYMGLDNSTLALTSRLGTGTADATTYLRGDRTYQKLPVSIYGGSLANAAGLTPGSWIVGRIPASRVGSAIKMQAYITGTTGTVSWNFRKNGTVLFHTADIVAGVNAWSVSTTIVAAANPLAVDDYIELILSAVSSATITQIFAQLEVQS